MATNSNKMTTFAATIKFLAVNSRCWYYNNIYGKDNKDFLAYRPKRMETTVYVSDKVVAIREVCLVLTTLY